MESAGASPDNTQFYTDGAKRMIAEGLEVVSRIIGFVRSNKARLTELGPVDRKKKILDFEPARTFNSIHPIVFHYLAVEGVFNQNAFKRYILSVYGKPKDLDELERIRGDRRAMYYHKNGKNALYYKYLLIETNPNVNKTTIHKMYETMVAELNADIDRMLDTYEKAEAAAKTKDAQYSLEKRKEIISIMKRKL